MAKIDLTAKMAGIRDAGLGVETQAEKIKILVGLALEMVDEGGSDSRPPIEQRRLNSLSCLLEYALQAVETVIDINGQVLMLSRQHQGG